MLLTYKSRSNYHLHQLHIVTHPDRGETLAKNFNITIQICKHLRMLLFNKQKVLFNSFVLLSRPTTILIF